MAAVVPFEGRDEIERAILNNGLTIRLFTNNLVPKDVSSFDTLEEPVDALYFPVPIYNDGTGVSAVFSLSASPKPIYGYYASSNDSIVFAERFKDGPYKINVSGSSMTIRINMEIR